MSEELRNINDLRLELWRADINTPVGFSQVSWYEPRNWEVVSRQLVNLYKMWQGREDVGDKALHFIVAHWWMVGKEEFNVVWVSSSTPLPAALQSAGGVR